MPEQMTFYSSRGAPNPRRVEVFMAEHGLVEGDVRARHIFLFESQPIYRV